MKRGQTVAEIARVFGISPFLLAEQNGLISEVEQGAVLLLPKTRGNAYAVRGGEKKSRLCGTVERYEALNGKAFYPATTVYLP